jgi:hypothetical protein
MRRFSVSSRHLCKAKVVSMILSPTSLRSWSDNLADFAEIQFIE